MIHAKRNKAQPRLSRVAAWPESPTAVPHAAPTAAIPVFPRLMYHFKHSMQPLRFDSLPSCTNLTSGLNSDSGKSGSPLLSGSFTVAAQIQPIAGPPSVDSAPAVQPLRFDSLPS